MGTLRVALGQLDLTVGDLDGNCAGIVGAARRAAQAGAHLLAVPEMALTGYPPEDLVLRASFRAASKRALTDLARALDGAGLGELAVVVGYLDEDPPGTGGPGGRATGYPRNAAAFCFQGEVRARYFKHHLPNYGVFDETRYFVPGKDLCLVRYRGVDVAMTICEDVWQDGGPFSVAREAGAGLVLNINGSPYERNKDDLRLPLLQRRAAEAGCPVVYVNMVGAQDELVFDGDSFVVRADGELLLRAPQFVEGVYCVDVEVADLEVADVEVADIEVADIEVADIEVADKAVADVAVADPTSDFTGPLGDMVVTRVDLGLPTARSVEPARTPLRAEVAQPLPDLAEVWQALVLGTGDYARKNGFASVVLGLSGGIDSAVVAAIAADAIGGANVYGVSMPSAYSSDHSRSDAQDTAQRLGAHYREVPIAAMVDAFVDGLSLTGLAEENVQARVRGTTLMGLSNQHGHLVLATGNKSELAVGYSTIYGDAVGGFAPLKDVPKGLVWELARWRNAEALRRSEIEPITPNSITKPPSAELRPGQLDSDSLPDYELLDAVIAGYVDHDLGLAELVAAGYDRELVQRVGRMIDAAEWKRRQYPPGPKISLKAFGRDRRLPISSRWRERGDLA